MRILFIAHYFHPEPNFFIGLPFAKELARRGHEVQVLTGLPNYPEGSIYDGYRVKFLRRDIIEGIPVIRVPLYPSHDRSALKRILSYISLSISQSSIGPFVVKDADMAFVSQGPATIGLPAMVHKMFRRIPFVYNIQDLWPDSLLSTGMFDNRFGLRLVNKWCNFVYKYAEKIVVIAPGMKNRLIEHGTPESKIEVIYNWCDDSLICRDEKDAPCLSSLGMADKFNIVFAGNIGKAQAMDAVLNAAKILMLDCPNAQFVLIGGGVEVEPLKKKTADMGLSNVKFLARRPISEIGPILRLADVLLVHLKNDPLFQITIPSKTQAYIAIGRPILIGVKGDAADLVEKANAGLRCEPEIPESIARAVRKLYEMPQSERDMMGKSGSEYYDKELSFSIATTKYEKIFESVVEKRNIEFP